jgi:ribosomal protein L11 methyltransferase
VRWLELTVEADAEAVEAVSEIFGRLGRGAAVRPTRLVADPADELAVREDPTAPYVVTAHIPDDHGAPPAVAATERALWHLQAFGLRPLSELRVRRVDDAAWRDAWRAGSAVQRIGRIVIVPSWLDEPLAAGELELLLDPGMAFGTGLHPTTRACLTLLQEVVPMPGTMLDVGSGSGILALAALRLGAQRAVCLDTDPLAVATTGANAVLNGLAARITVTEGTLPGEAAARYPLVSANLVAHSLIELAPRLSAHLAPGGRLITSGIVAARAGKVERALAEAGLRVERRMTDPDWTSLVLAHGGAFA